MPKKYVCPKKCGKKYKYKAGLSSHLKYECGVEPKFECYVCYRKFAHRSNMRSHLCRKHKILS